MKRKPPASQVRERREPPQLDHGVVTRNRREPPQPAPESGATRERRAAHPFAPAPAARERKPAPLKKKTKDRLGNPQRS